MLGYSAIMGKKRKHSEAEAVAPAKKDDAAPERPKRTLLGWKDKNEVKDDVEDVHSPVFRNKEKVLVTCSRRISYRYDQMNGGIRVYLLTFLNGSYGANGVECFPYVIGTGI